MPQDKNKWYLVSSHGAVLFYIAVNPDCTIKQIAEKMSLTRRTVWGIVGDLRRKGMIKIRKDGRRHHYTVNLKADAKFTHPIMEFSMDTVLGQVVRQHAERSANP